MQRTKVNEELYVIHHPSKGVDRDWWLAHPDLRITLTNFPRELDGKHIKIKIEVIGGEDSCVTYPVAEIPI